MQRSYRSDRLVWLSALGAVITLSVIASSRNAAADEPAKDSLPIAVLNLDRIMNPTLYQPLVKRLAPLKAEVAELDLKAKTRQVELETVQNQLRAATPGRPDFERLRLQQTKLQTELQLFIDRERKAVQQKESAIYLELYREIETEVEKYCKAHGIKLVLRQQGAEVKTSDSPQEILKLLNRAVVYEDGLDITDAIVKALAAKGPSDE